MISERQKIEEAADFVKKRIAKKPEIAIILGTGLGELVASMEIYDEIPYNLIPYFPTSTMEFHRGKLLFGTFCNKNIMAFQGKFHYYEGLSMQQIVMPVRLSKLLGVEKLFISNAAGCLNPAWKKSEVMLIDDHINLLPDNPLRSSGTGFGSIFVDLSTPYDETLQLQAKQAATTLGLTLHSGVYVSVQGPNLETKAEYRYLRTIGADAVGMSTVPEVIAANQIQLPVCAFSVFTDECNPDHLERIELKKMSEMAKIGEQTLVKILEYMLT